MKKTPLSKKRRGPALTGVGTPQLVRIHDRQLAEIDAWAARQDDKISRPEAIRRLVEIGLKARTPPNKVSIEFYPMKRAAELAVQAIDEMIDCNARPKNAIVEGCGSPKGRLNFVSIASISQSEITASSAAARPQSTD